MTKHRTGLLRYDVLVASVLLGSGLAELAMREGFYRVSSEAHRIVGLLIVWATILASAAWVSVCRMRSGQLGLAQLDRRGGAWVGPIFVGIAAAVWVQLVCGPWLANALDTTLGAELGPWLVLLALIVGLTIAGVRLPSHVWLRLRRGIGAAAVIFVLAQPALAYWYARDILWPGPAEKSDSTLAPPETQVFVLLDEWNDKAAGPVMAAMARAGHPVLHRALTPVGDGTAKVVPSIFARTPFLDAKPCSLDTVCSGNQVLDFSRIHASRPDIDIVGFYLPYCAIRGLRSCHVAMPASPIFDLERWKCALLRRSAAVAGQAGEPWHRRCAALNGNVWSELASDVETQIWNSPVWKDGGVLFAHVPLPHPPGEDPSQGLGLHYAANLQRAARLIGQMAEALGREPTRRFSLVVFSDHPLRTSMWCGSTQYMGAACASDDTLIDDRVPLLVTGEVPSAFGRLQSNLEVFDLLRHR